jgi:hypothetical protein
MLFTLLRNKVFRTSIIKEISSVNSSFLGWDYFVYVVFFGVEYVLTSNPGNLQRMSEFLRRIMRRTMCTSRTRLEL